LLFYSRFSITILFLEEVWECDDIVVFYSF